MVLVDKTQVPIWDIWGIGNSTAAASLIAILIGLLGSIWNNEKTIELTKNSYLIEEKLSFLTKLKNNLTYINEDYKCRNQKFSNECNLKKFLELKKSIEKKSNKCIGEQNNLLPFIITLEKTYKKYGMIKKSFFENYSKLFNSTENEIKYSLVCSIWGLLIKNFFDLDSISIDEKKIENESINISNDEKEEYRKFRETVTLIKLIKINDSFSKDNKGIMKIVVEGADEEEMEGISFEYLSLKSYLINEGGNKEYNVEWKGQLLGIYKNLFAELDDLIIILEKELDDVWEELTAIKS